MDFAMLSVKPVCIYTYSLGKTHVGPFLVDGLYLGMGPLY
jgi:hypothetical protein